MSLRDRLLVGFLVVLAALAANEGIYLWSVKARAGGLAAVDTVHDREVALMSLQREVEVVHRQLVIGLRLSGANLPSALALDRRTVEGRLQRIDGEINALLSIDGPAPLTTARPLSDACQKLTRILERYFESDDPAARASHLAEADAVA